MMKRGRRNRNKKPAMKDDTGSIILDLVARYLLLIVLALGDLWIFYFIFKPLTLYPTGLLLKLFFNVGIYKEAISVNGYIIGMAAACIAGSAYYFLTILNLTTRGINLLKRIKIFLFSAFLFLALNIIRIFVLAMLLVKEIALFDITHKILWYGISTIYVILVWLLAVKVFNIKTIPFYSDFSFLREQIKKEKGKKARVKHRIRKKAKKRRR